jgi:catechol 2,3-dioxygenase
MRRVASDRDYGIAPTRFRLPEESRLGPVHLQISDLGRSSEYYSEMLGLIPTAIDECRVALHARGDAVPLIELHHDEKTRPVPKGGVLGLYHFAILLPDRASLGRFVAHLVQAGTQFGAADHLVSEAIYLWDPDGLGIEVYADRPREAWRVEGRELLMTTERLDIPSVISAGGGVPWDGMPAGTILGHMHLSVADLIEARRFYHDGLGFGLTVWSYPGALFMSAGGYHHHLGTNTWAAGARRATPHDARLRQWELLLPNREDIRAATESLRAAGYDAKGDIVVDPWGTALRLTV